MKQKNIELKEFRGIFHIHSSYSHDGKVPLSEIVKKCKSQRYDFVVITDHAESFEDEKHLNKFISECDSLTDNDVLLIPGLEFICDKMHILGIGIGELLNPIELPALIYEIKKRGGLAVLAHVTYYDKIPYDKLIDLDGIEVWNSRYEGRFSPSLKSLEILKRFRKQNKEILAFGGLDLHKEHEFGRMSTLLNANELSLEGVLRALRKGEFHTSNGLIKFDSKKDPSLYKLFIFYIIRFPYAIGKTLRKFISITLNKIGIKPPKTLITK